MIEHKIGYYDNGKVKFENLYRDGKIHNDNGPAILRYYENGMLKIEEYWLDNYLTSKEEWNFKRSKHYMINNVKYNSKEEAIKNAKNGDIIYEAILIINIPEPMVL